MIKYICAKLLKKIHISAVKESNIDSTSRIESGSTLVDVKMDRYSFCGYDCWIINTEIGSFCSIANNVVIGGAMHPISWVSTSPVFYYGRDSVKKKFSTFKRDKDARTFIGHDVWIGEGVIIKQGVKIGNGAVVGMGSIVTKDVEPYSIVAGNPARLIRKRFEESVCQSLNQSQWWLLPDDEIESLAKYIMNPKEFIKKL